MSTHARNSPDSPDRIRIHDLHAHILPSMLLHPQTWHRDDLPVSVRTAAGITTLRIGARELPSPPADLIDLERRLHAMDASGVDVQVVSPWMELSPAGLAQTAAVPYIRIVNNALAEAVDRHPDRLVGMGMVPSGDGRAAAAELERVVDRGMCGIILATSGVGLDLGDAELEPLWHAAARTRALVMLHPFEPLAAARLRAVGLGDLLGTPMESAVAVGSLLRAGVIDRHPKVRFCVVHGGGPLPALAGRLDALWEVAGGSPDSPRPSAQLRRLHFDTLTHGDQALRWLGQFAGWDRLMLGSDFPFPTGDLNPADRVRRVTRGNPLARRGVLGATLERLIGDVRPVVATDNS